MPWVHPITKPEATEKNISKLAASTNVVISGEAAKAGSILKR